MFRRLITLTTISACLLISGCATPKKMAFADDDRSTTRSENPIYLMTATLRNNFKESFQPNLSLVHLVKKEDKGNENTINFSIDNKAIEDNNSKNIGNTYLLRMELDKGQYIIRGLSSQASSFPIIGTYFAPIHSTLDSNEPGIYYLGHIDATIRERTGNEFKAGSTIPLIDQAVAGASTGTFDIQITDEWENDEGKFRSKFPALNNVAVKKAILPPFNRKVAQQWWESH